MVMAMIDLHSKDARSYLPSRLVESMESDPFDLCTFNPRRTEC